MNAVPLEKELGISNRWVLRRHGGLHADKDEQWKLGTTRGRPRLVMRLGLCLATNWKHTARDRPQWKMTKTSPETLITPHGSSRLSGTGTQCPRQ